MDIAENIELQNVIGNALINSKFGNIINSTIESGIKALLPDYIEDNIIEIKNNLLDKNFSGIIENVIDTAVQVGKNKIGNITDKFESINQISEVFNGGNLIERISKVFESALNKANEKGIINNNIVEKIKERERNNSKKCR